MADPAPHTTPGTGAAPPADAGTHRETLGHFASGVVVVTAHTPSGPVGFTCQSFASLSLDPPLVSFAVSRTSRTWPLIRDTSAFCVNVLAQEQEDLSTAFARSGEDRFRQVSWTPGHRGAPSLDGACAWIGCDLVHEYEGGDHTIVVGRVASLRADPARDPLVFHRGRYRTLAQPGGRRQDGGEPDPGRGTATGPSSCPAPRHV
ncbi:flavin reductase [Streptomyces sp. Tu 6176]|uniref:flavin reductase family protein n=1 Tax=Streptomyces sp. Tu 6176 TaxID=1470557 RepID=UPI000450E5B7|nr:flavin reductase family protein [Streptomyces sp. Tu 6176]EYT81862.1 flavin reductase [Streptomyces sp. Tu 6176]